MAPLPVAIALSPPPLPSNPTQKPSKSFLRRATLRGSTIRTRDEAGLDLDASIDSSPPSPGKRARTVSFSPMVGLAQDCSALDLEAVRLEVRAALETHVRGGSDEAYDALKEVFMPATRGAVAGGREQASSEKVKTHLLALTSCVSLLGKSCSGLVKAVLECDWIGRDEGFVKIYAHFLGNLASAQGVYVGTILNMLVGKFTGCESDLKPFPT